MAVTVEGKLELFKKVLFEHIEEDWAEKRDKFIGDMEEKKKEQEKEFIKRKKALEEDGENRAQAKIRSIIAKVQGDADTEIMKKKEELLMVLIETLKSWSRGFVRGDKYQAFLERNIDNSMLLIKGKNILFSFTQKDLNELGAFIRKQIEKSGDQRNIQLTVSKDDIIGGFTVEDKESGVLGDFTIKTLIDEGKEYMGKMLYERLDEVLKA